MSFRPTYLYVKTHNITGLKYFGKTINDPLNYTGSGKWWTRHLAVHGNNVTTEVIGFYINENDCVSAATRFSKENNIVESSEWANLCIENGTDGGYRLNNHFRILNQLPKTENFLKRVSEANIGNQHRSIKIRIDNIDYNSIRDASIKLSKSEQTIYQWIKKGKAIKLNKP